MRVGYWLTLGLVVAPSLTPVLAQDRVGHGGGGHGGSDGESELHGDGGLVGEKVG